MDNVCFVIRTTKQNQIKKKDDHRINKNSFFTKGVKLFFPEKCKEHHTQFHVFCYKKTTLTIIKELRETFSL